MSNKARLVFYEEAHKQALEAFTLSEEQLQFTSLPTQALGLCLQDPTRHPVVILACGVPVGFFVLHRGEQATSSYTANPGAILLRALSMNSGNQGRGYGTEAMRAVPDFVRYHFPKVTEIVLAVNERNTSARKVYEKAGYVDDGLRKDGRSGTQAILVYKVV